MGGSKLDEKHTVSYSVLATALGSVTVTIDGKRYNSGGLGRVECVELMDRIAQHVENIKMEIADAYKTSIDYALHENQRKIKRRCKR